MLFLEPFPRDTHAASMFWILLLKHSPPLKSPPLEASSSYSTSSYFSFSSIVVLLFHIASSSFSSWSLLFLIMERLFPHPGTCFSILHLEPPPHPWVSNPAWSILQSFSWIPSSCSIFFLMHLTGFFSRNLCLLESSRLRAFSKSHIPLEFPLGAFSWCFLLLEPPSGVSTFWCFLVPEPPPPGAFSLHWVYTPFFVGPALQKLAIIVQCYMHDTQHSQIVISKNTLTFERTNNFL